MNIYGEHLTKNGFSLEDFKELARQFEAVTDNALFKAEYFWLKCEKNSQQNFLNDIKDYFSTYTRFEKLNILKTDEGLWVKPFLGDYVSGGKYRYLDDMISSEYVINLNGGCVTEEELKKILPYEHYIGYFKEENMREPLGFWLVNEDDTGYNSVRNAVLENVNKSAVPDLSLVIERVEMLLGKSTEITEIGFPTIDKEKIISELISDYESFDRTQK